MNLYHAYAPLEVRAPVGGSLTFMLAPRRQAYLHSLIFKSAVETHRVWLSGSLFIEDVPLFAMTEARGPMDFLDEDFEPEHGVEIEELLEALRNFATETTREKTFHLFHEKLMLSEEDYVVVRVEEGDPELIVACIIIAADRDPNGEDD